MNMTRWSPLAIIIGTLSVVALLSLVVATSLQISAVLVAAVVSLLLACAIALFQVPRWQAREIPDLTEQWKGENEARRTLAQVFGGIALLAGLAFTWVQIKETEQHNRQSEVAEDSKLRNEQFARAVEKVASEHVHVRLAGVYALGQLANRSRDDFWPVMELLTSYIRERSPVGVVHSGDDSDVEAAVKIVIWRDVTCDPAHIGQSLDFHSTDLEAFDLGEASLDGADFRGANLDSANLRGAHLKGAHFGFSYEKQTTLRWAVLQGADLRDVNFDKFDMLDDGWDVWFTNVAGLAPPELRAKLIRLGAVEQPNEQEWLKQRRSVGFEKDRLMLFRSSSGCPDILGR
jgi:uncharacterized protein YjbI with pentapeptide repeats